MRVGAPRRMEDGREVHCRAPGRQAGKVFNELWTLLNFS